MIRWLIARDLPRCMEIENRSFEFPWSIQEFRDFLRLSNTIGMVVEDEDREIVGFMVYGLCENRLEIFNIAVDPERTREGWGKKMLLRLQDKVGGSDRRRFVDATVREVNLPGQLFFKDSGFRAVGITTVDAVDGEFSETAYDMRWDCLQDESEGYTPRNRINAVVSAEEDWSSMYDDDEDWDAEEV